MVRVTARSRCARVAAVLVALGIGNAVLAATPAASDTMEQRLAACTSCHGAHGAGLPDDPRIPSLAGKPAGYLLKQMQQFQTGQRRNTAMAYVVRQLSPEYLRQIAEYYAGQPVSAHGHPVPDVPAAELERGEQLVLHGDPAHGVPSCASCHGERLTGVEPMIPGLMGLTYDYMRAQLELWRAHDRAATGTFCMGIVANRMQQGDINAVSAWLAGQTPPADMRPLASPKYAEPLPGWCVVDAQEHAP